MAQSTEGRKASHVEICMQKDVEYRKDAGFSDIEFIHNALPELDLERIETSCTLFNKKLSAPILIEAITGGYPAAKEINKKLASAAEKKGIAFSLGSIRPMLENEKLRDTYEVRDVAPSIFLIGNIGAAQLKQFELKKIEEALKAVGADALAIHLNPLQEALQSEGDKNFSGCLNAIENACSHLSLPVIVKETGAGLSKDVALKLKGAGVRMLDVGGAGGTSWSRVEYERGEGIPGFEEWGIPTVQSILLCAPILPTIASGGVRSGIDVAKAIALGASYAGAALPFLRSKNPENEIEVWIAQLRTVMFLTGCRNIEELKKAKILITGKTAEAVCSFGIYSTQFAQR